MMVFQGRCFVRFDINPLFQLINLHPSHDFKNLNDPKLCIVKLTLFQHLLTVRLIFFDFYDCTNHCCLCEGWE